MKPYLYLSYGIPKSGSTLAFELTKAVFEQNGYQQVQLPSAILPGGHPVNFMRNFNDEATERLWAAVERIGYPIVVKTHGALTRAARRLLEEGKAIGHCVYRDPRENILSLLDAGEQARRAGTKAFSEITSIDIAAAQMTRRIEMMKQWKAAPNVIPLYYSDTAFETRRVVQVLADQVGLPVDADRAERTVKLSKFTQFNKGRKDRHLTDLTAEQNELLYLRFRDFIDADCHSLLEAISAQPIVDRLKPCPCGSGRRYKHCHGRLT